MALLDDLEMFPVHSWRDYEKQYSKCPSCVPIGLIHDHEVQADDNHGQTVGTLKRRGGLSPIEMYAVLKDLHWQDVYDTDAHEPRVPLEQMIDYINERCEDLIGDGEWMPWMECNKQHRKDNNIV
jgi:hypothetical protein